MEWFKKLIAQIRGRWGKWTVAQKLVLGGIAAAVVAGAVALVSVSSAPTLAPVIDAPIRDEDLRDKIVLRLAEEGVKVTVSPAGIVQVADEKTARRMRAILIREDLIPTGADPWAVFDRERWTITDFERNVNLQRAIQAMVTEHIEALDEVDKANVQIVTPERTLFTVDQNPVTASVILTPRPGSDITTNRKKIEGIQKILKYAVEGLKDENITIADQSGLVLNDFEGAAESDRLTLIERQTKMIQKLETQYRAAILRALQSIYTADRVRDLNIKIDMDMSKKSVESQEFLPIFLQERTPGSSYDDSVMATSASGQAGVLSRSSSVSTTTYEGTGFNPEGPAGVEGQVPPAYKDMTNTAGKMTQTTQTVNEELNTRRTVEEKSPQIDRVTVAVNIDGTWKRKYDEKRKPIVGEDGTIEREYTALSREDIAAATALIQSAIGYSAARGDSVTVQNIRFDRTAQFQEEDSSYFERRQVQFVVLIVCGAVLGLLLIFLGIRFVSRQMERKKRDEAEERARKEEALRQKALMDAEEAGAAMDVSMSVEERGRMELMEGVSNMVKEHPEDVAQLIRTWLLEE